MALIAKKLAQTALSDTASAIVTPATGSKVYVTSFRLINTGSVDRKVTLYAHGNTTNNTVLIATIKAQGAYIETKNEAQIVLDGDTDILYAKQDAGADVIFTLYGTEEV